MTLARRLATGDTYTVFVTSRMRTETRASSASVYGSSVVVHYTDTSASHEYLCALMQNVHETFYQTTSNSHVFKLHLKNKCYKLRKLRETFM